MKFAIIRRNGLGDFISATVPVCNYIKDKHPEAELHLFLSRQNSPLAKYFFPNEHIYTIGSGNKYLVSLIAALRHRVIKPEVGIAPTQTYNRLNGLFLAALGAKSKLGIETGDAFEKLLFTRLTTVTEQTHVALQNINLIDESLTEIDKRYFPKFDKSIIKAFDVRLPHPRIIIEASNNRKTSQLNNEKVSNILNRIHEVSPVSVMISIRETDREKAMALKQCLHMPSDIFVTPTLDDFISMVNQADFFLFGDGGASHIAGALNKAGVSVYGKTSVPRWAVLSENVIHLYDEDDVNNVSNDEIEKNLLSVVLTRQFP